MSEPTTATPPTVEQWAATQRAKLPPRVAAVMAKANRYQVIGPTVAKQNLLIMDDGRCVATIKFDDQRPEVCRQRAIRLARAEPRLMILKHLLAEMESDESRWSNEIQMIREELKVSRDDVDA